VLTEELDLSRKAGIAAAGHLESSRAAADVLEAGGNAFDAALAALSAACVVEPMLASLGGGGFLLAQPAGEAPLVYDFFVHTPCEPRPAGEIDFYPILADFGTAKQEFHIGMGSIAVPGVVAGLFEVHRQRCRLPIAEILAPAIRLARDGVLMNDFQTYISHILSPILEANPSAMKLVATSGRPTLIAEPGEKVSNWDLAAALEALVDEGPDLFYRGELARRLVADCRDNGGHLVMKDLEQYRVRLRQPVRFSCHGAEFSFNSPPSPSGCLTAFALGLLEDQDLKTHRWGRPHHCLSLGYAMRAAGLVRHETHADGGLDDDKAADILNPGNIDQWRGMMAGNPMAPRGTTQISVADADGNLASLTISNGEGCAYVLPGAGIMLNNMLGEEDLNPAGFHNWAPNRRMSSMMCPSVASLPDGGWVALGSGGSNRIRSAILQVLLNLFEFDMPLEQAVAAPRMHLEGDHLSLEEGFHESGIEALSAEWPDQRIWPDLNLFFGGVHAVERLPDGSFRGAGDPRRGGTVAAAR
jgi:gamma-glutamyltranspeptidase/glutathione hydrolase